MGCFLVSRSAGGNDTGGAALFVYKAKVSRWVLLVSLKLKLRHYRVDRFVFGSEEQERTFSIDKQAQLAVHAGALQHTLLFGLDHERSTFEQTTFWGGSARLRTRRCYGRPSMG